MYDQSNPGTAEPVLESHFGNFVGVSVLAPGTTHCAVSTHEILYLANAEIWQLNSDLLQTFNDFCQTF